MKGDNYNETILDIVYNIFVYRNRIMDLSDLAANLLQQQRSTPDLIADALRKAIVAGIFQEGQSLRQDEIASKFGVSRIPVREALRQLEAEGLVTLHPHRGATVSTLSAAEVQEICEICIALETTAIELAIPQMTTSNLQKAKAILEATEKEIETSRWVELNWEFHATLYAPANRPRLLAMIKTLHVNIDRYIRLQFADVKYRERSHQEHYQLLQACMQQDTKAAVELLKQHIRQ